MPAWLETPEAVGSNGWVVGPSHTAAGKTLLLGNPHLGWGGWQTYYEIQLTAPGIDLYGATQIGVPALRFVFSKYLWFQPDGKLYRTASTSTASRLRTTATSSTAKPCRSKKSRTSSRSANPTAPSPPKRFRSHAPFTVPSFAMTTALPSLCASLHSTVPSCWSSTGRWKPRTTSPVSRRRSARLQVPCFNVLYGDRDGHIEYLYNGTVPRRSKGDLAYWAGVVPGDTSETLWHDYLTYDELPKGHRPSQRLRAKHQRSALERRLA